MSEKATVTVTAAAAAAVAFGAAALGAGPGVSLAGAAAAAALGGMAGNLLTSSTTWIGRTFQEQVLDRWGPVANSQEIADGLRHASTVAMQRVVRQVFQGGRSDPNLTRWTNVITPFSDAASKAVGSINQDEGIEAAAAATVGGQPDLQLALENLALQGLSESIQIAVSDFPAEFLAVFKGDGTVEKPGWFSIYCNQVRAQLARDSNFSRAWQNGLMALMLVVMRELVDAGAPPLDLGVDNSREASGLDRFVYIRRWTQLIGRREEMERLMNFANPAVGNAMQFMLVAGPGGRGKSRLALEACRLAAERYGMQAGFLSRASAPAQGWQHWKQTLPTMMVIDYAATRAEEVHDILVALTLPGRQLAHPVRLLLLDREAGLEAAFADGNNTTSHRMWTDIVAGGASHESQAIKAAYAGEFTLAPVTDPWPIMQSVFEAKGKAPLPERDALTALRVVDPAGSPLFAVLVADALADGETVRDGDRYTFLLSVIHKVGILPKAPALRDLTLNSGALATLTRRVSATALLLLYEQFDSKLAPRFRPPDDDMNIVVDAVAQLTGYRDGQWLHGLEPDLLGEVLILSRCQIDDANAVRRAETLRELCWRIPRDNPPQRTGFTRPAVFWAEELLRLAASDFPEAMVRSGLLKAPDVRDPVALSSWAVTVRGILHRMLTTGLVRLAITLFQDVVVPATSLDGAPQAVDDLRLWVSEEIFGFLLQSGNIHEALSISTAELNRKTVCVQRSEDSGSRARLAERHIFAAIEVGQLDSAFAAYRQHLVPGVAGDSERYVDWVLPASANALTIAMLRSGALDAAEDSLRVDFSTLSNVGELARAVTLAHLKHLHVDRAVALLKNWPALVDQSKIDQWNADRMAAAFSIWFSKAIETGWLQSKNIKIKSHVPGLPRREGRSINSSMVFYDYNRSALTTEGRNTAWQAASRFCRERDLNPDLVFQVIIVGRTDTAEPVASRTVLSERRAEFIRDLLVVGGIEGGSVMVSGIGTADPMTPTGENVREPKNRRATAELIYTTAQLPSPDPNAATAERWSWLNRFFLTEIASFAADNPGQPILREVARKTAQYLQFMRAGVDSAILEEGDDIASEKVLRMWIE
jgi:outer membrane protein OmpA-like peptidoglycan-associated protein